MMKIRECLSYLSDIDFDRETLKAAREELASITQRASSALPPPDLERAAALAWNEAVEAAATRLEERAKECWSVNTTLSGTMRHVYGEEAAIIRALKRTT